MKICGLIILIQLFINIQFISNKNNIKKDSSRNIKNNLKKFNKYEKLDEPIFDYDLHENSTNNTNNTNHL